MEDRYKWVGRIYDMLSYAYGGKSIHSCKTAMLDHLQPGDKVLFAGVGHGRDAIDAAQRGADVTVVDMSETMLLSFQRNLAKVQTKGSIRQIHRDIFKVSEYAQYDMVVANFFLNVFDRQTMFQVLRHLIDLGKPGANIVIGDFAPATDHLVSRLLKALYWYPAILFFCLVTQNALHRIYPYPDALRLLGLKVVAKKHFGFWGMKTYWSILAKKPQDQHCHPQAASLWQGVSSQALMPQGCVLGE